ncbi:hypothetical protein ABZ714_30915 [Streptomyces sp. NPDC006798]|uniref:hypothetical protein n=1 Tax=Streptomyces sp. NPDC006798 TaxID=3155462 RepID=UPI0033F600BC
MTATRTRDALAPARVPAAPHAAPRTPTRRTAGTVTLPPAGRAMRAVAAAAALTVLPSGLWRIAIAFGWDSGFGEGALHRSEFPGTGSLYLIALSVFAELLGLLALGLVRPWGEAVPPWVPLLGGRRIPTAAAVIPASLGALAVTLITVQGAFAWNDPDNMGAPGAPEGDKYWIMTAAYAPLLLWGPLLAVVTVAYCLRRGRAAVAGRPAR